jgi:hypothetical protein
MALKSLPIGKQTFTNISTGNSLYVDKTEHLYKLINECGRYFLSRPRRFGKSVTCSTLATIFEGRNELFRDLWIGTSDYKWETYPVVYLDFSELSYDTPQDLRGSLHEELDRIAHNHDVAVDSSFFKTKLKNLIIKLHEKYGPVVVIIDEYDKPIVEHIDNLDVAEKMQTILRGLYGAFKGTSLDKHLHFLFITGVSKFSKVSLFSEVNNLDDITTKPIAAALVGYTEAEVDKYLHEHIQAFAEKRQESYQSTRELLRAWYNGYQFSDDQAIKVYNPFSLHNCLSSNRLRNYWFASGTTNFLIKIIKKNAIAFKNFVSQDSWILSAAGMESFSPEVYHKKILPLLLQTGYLTIKSYDAIEDNYTLDYPDREVRESMTKQIMEYVADIPTETLGKIIARFIRALAADNIDEYCATLRDYLKLIPHNIIASREKFFQATFVGTALIVDPRAVVSEVATDRGYVDIVLHGATKTFIMEFKFDKTPKLAMEQILEKKYYEKYVIMGEQVTLVGINFDLDKKGVEVAWITAAPPLLRQEAS